MSYLDEDKAVYIIKNYLNVADNPKWTKEYVMKNYGIVVEMLIEQSTSPNLSNATGIKEKNEGNMKIIYDTSIKPWTITDNLKSLLPLPYIKVMG